MSQEELDVSPEIPIVPLVSSAARRDVRTRIPRWDFESFTELSVHSDVD
jgi:hypothetical protein